MGFRSARPLNPSGSGGEGVHECVGLASLVNSAVDAILIALCEEAVECPRPKYCLWLGDEVSLIEGDLIARVRSDSRLMLGGIAWAFGY
jgi:hypothetical protein